MGGTNDGRLAFQGPIGYYRLCSLAHAKRRPARVRDSMRLTERTKRKVRSAITATLHDKSGPETGAWRCTDNCSLSGGGSAAAG
jgi:hypothetical protein